MGAGCRLRPQCETLAAFGNENGKAICCLPGDLQTGLSKSFNDEGAVGTLCRHDMLANIGMDIAAPFAPILRHRFQCFCIHDDRFIVRRPV